MTGACHKSLQLTTEEVKEHLAEGHVCWDRVDVIKGKSTGSGEHFMK